MRYLAAFVLLWSLCLPSLVQAQFPLVSDIVEVTGIVTTRNSMGRIEFVPFVTITIEGNNRGTYANHEGMYGIVLKKGQSLKFSAIGYKDKIVEVPVSVSGLHYSLVVELEVGSVDLDEVVVFPWPDRHNFRAEFLALDPGTALNMEEVARRNLDRRNMLEIAKATGMDARENATYHMRKQARDFSYMGQVPPMRIFDPLAWGQFIQMLGDNKKKARKERLDED